MSNFKIIQKKIFKLFIHYKLQKIIKPVGIRIRIIIFSWIKNFLLNKKIVDLFSGTGILGFTSVFFQIKSVILIEKNKKVYSNLLKNKKNLNINNITILNYNAIYWIIKNTKKINIIFIDPPFKLYNLNVFFNYTITFQNIILFVRVNIFLKYKFFPKNILLIKILKLGNSICYLFLNMV